MGRPRKQQDEQFTNLSDTGTSTVANRKTAEAERQAEARRVRDELVKETKDAQKATAQRLEAKPTDSRTITNTP